MIMVIVTSRRNHNMVTSIEKRKEKRKIRNKERKQRDRMADMHP